MKLEDIKKLGLIVGVDPVTAAMDAAYGFDMEQQEALRDMFQAFYDTLQKQASLP